MSVKRSRVKNGWRYRFATAWHVLRGHSVVANCPGEVTITVLKRLPNGWELINFNNEQVIRLGVPGGTKVVDKKGQPWIVPHGDERYLFTDPDGNVSEYERTDDGDFRRH